MNTSIASKVHPAKLDARGEPFVWGAKQLANVNRERLRRILYGGFLGNVLPKPGGSRLPAAKGRLLAGKCGFFARLGRLPCLASFRTARSAAEGSEKCWPSMTL